MMRILNYDFIYLIIKNFYDCVTKYGKTRYPGWGGKHGLDAYLCYIATNELTSAPIYDRYQPTNTDGREGSKQNSIELFIFIQNFAHQMITFPDRIKLFGRLLHIVNYYKCRVY